MRLRFQTTLALLVILAAVPWSGCGRERDSTFRRDPSALVPVIPDGFGVNIHFTDPQPGEMKMLAAAGVHWVRMDFKWDLTEPAKGTYDFAPYDRLMSALAPFGLRALFILDYGNPLYDDGGPPRTEATRQAFARWAVAAARHFAGRGIIWETYNEPNNEMFWRPRPEVDEYAALALVVARAFRAAVPDERLVGPAIAEMDFAFLEGCFRAGLLEYWSAVSVHPYLRSNPELVSGDYYHLREMIKTYSPVRTGSGPGSPRGQPAWGGGSDRVTTTKDIPIISGEWGYSSVWPGMNEEKQGQFLARQWLTNVANDIPLSIWYDWRDDGSDPNEPEHHFGMVSNAYHEGRDPVYDPKPAYLAAKTLTAFFNGYRFEKRLDVGGAEDYLLVFRKAGSPAGQPRWGANGDELRFAAWTTANEAHNVLLPLNASRYTTTKHTGQNASVVGADQKGLRINLTTAPVYIR